MSTTVNDRFDTYFSEKIWAMIPDIYRFQDGLAANPGVLRAMIEVLAREAAILRRSQDRLWEDQSIETCDDWAIPYIGALVATRMISALNKRGSRVDVAKTIYYRRRKGTPRVLEQLISDITGWDGRLVECFQRLGRARHGLDPQPSPYAGPMTGTLPGGWADLRAQRGSELCNGPYDEYYHTPDFRLNRGLEGIYNIPKLAFYLYRLVAYPVEGVTPFSLNDGLRFTFDPSGRSIPLFMRRNRPSDWDQWHSALEWELPAPIHCRLLGQAIYRISLAVITGMTPVVTPAALIDLKTLVNRQFDNESRLQATIATLSTSAELLSLPVFIPLLKFSLIDQCGKSRLLPDALALLKGGTTVETGSISINTPNPATALTAESCTAGNLGNWSAPSPDKQVVIDPERGRFLMPGPPVNPLQEFVSYYYGFSGPLGAGTYSRPSLPVFNPPTSVIQNGGPIAAAQLPGNGSIQIQDSATYGPLKDTASIQSRTFQAADLQRPYLWLDGIWTLDTGANTASRLILDGLWIGNEDKMAFSIKLKGNYSSVIIRNCTLDPGGDTNALGDTINPLPLIIEGVVDQLCIQNSILASISVDPGGELENLTITDSIIQSSPTAIATPLSKVQICRSTIYGQVQADRLYASDSLFTGLVTVTDTQDGCFRFSTAPAVSRLPRPYQSWLYSGDPAYWFTSSRFGQPGFAQLSDVAPVEVYRGAEQGTEMGAFNSLINPIKQDGLFAKIEEYMPFGLIPVIIHET